MADKIVVMNEGEIIQVGTPLELFDNPKNLFVASFLGSPEINLLEGIVQAHKGKTFLLVNENVMIPLPNKIKLTEGAKTTIGIRPQSLKISKLKRLLIRKKYCEMMNGLRTEFFLHLKIY